MARTVKTIADALLSNISQVIQDKEEIIQYLLIALFSGGHVLLEDVPGVGKTKLAQALARSIHTKFRRIQFTPDMMPSDITGISIYDERSKQFVFMQGPVFTNILLADEINRGTPRVQSSLLECMEESCITVDGAPHILQKPFFVIATQNPVEFHGTYPLPEAQLDRFAMRLTMGYPSHEKEKEILLSQSNRSPLDELQSVTTEEEILHCQQQIKEVTVSDPVRDYIVTIIEETRHHPSLPYGCSPRASLTLMKTAQAKAAIEGRDYVLPRDVRNLAPAVLSHRLPRSINSQVIDNQQLIKDITSNLPIMRWEKTLCQSKGLH